MNLFPCCLGPWNTQSNIFTYCSLKAPLALHASHSVFNICVASEPSCSAENERALHHVLNVGYFMGWKPEHSDRKVLYLVVTTAC